MAVSVFPAFDVNRLETVFLLSLRLGATFLATPVLPAAGVPAIVRVLVVLALATALSFGLPGTGISVGADGHAGSLFQAALSELALGMTLALGILLAFATFVTAGRLLDIQIGFGIAQVLDPATNTRMPIFATAYNQAAVVVFFLINGHHALLRGLAYSLERFPLGTPWPLMAALAPVTKQAAGLLSLSFALAAPVVFCVLMAEMALGVIAKNLPQMNMLTMGIPVKIAVGVIAGSVWFAGIGSVMSRAYEEIYRCWDAIFASVAASGAVDGDMRQLVAKEG
ncbi:type III secretion protein [Ralstonia sp. A12]|uniref:flagellar biosynthetic protein FliR n=1 Tax=Ralstonia sp. A12 TaxID=1217052 RepID=UPI000573D687|nr:flagellar biosynthetic protein FliR [Ralstonia sp. A12]KHK58675.1 type III secretion protein [Ralstonia sp. A12]